MSQDKDRIKVDAEVTIDLKWIKIKFGGEWVRTKTIPKKPKQKPSK